MSEASENVYLYVFISWLVYFYLYLHKYFFDVVRNKLQTTNIKSSRRSKVQEKKCHKDVFYILTNETIFQI